MVLPALGHEGKAAGSGLRGWHEHVWSRRMLECRGIKHDSYNAYARLKGGTSIREAERHVLMEGFSFRVAWAKRFLRQHEADITTMDSAPDPTTASTVNVIDAFGRSEPLSFIPEMEDVAVRLRDSLRH